MRIVLATANTHKVAELGALLGGIEVEAAPAVFDVEETGATMLQNALLKARALRRQVPGEALVVADDSGITIHALGGRPGVHSRRYAGPDATDDDNNRRLLTELAGSADRRAAFVCVLVAIDGDDEVTVCCGVCPGDIAREPRGQGGFGYDPLFVARGMDRSMAELDPADKNAISHRGRAARLLAGALGFSA